MTQRKILLLSTDLLGASQISGAFSVSIETAFPVTLEHVMGLAALKSSFEQEPQTLFVVIVDLANSNLKISDLIEWLQQREKPPLKVFAYGPHVETERLEVARKAGCKVFSRGLFITNAKKIIAAAFQESRE